MHLRNCMAYFLAFSYMLPDTRRGVLVAAAVLAAALAAAWKTTEPFDDPFDDPFDAGDLGGFDFADDAPDASPQRSWGKPSADQYENNKRIVRATGSAQLDVVMYGDSITGGLYRVRATAWDPYFKSLKTAVMGVGGNLVDDVQWRLQNGEKFATDPKVIVLLIGINDLRSRDPAPRLAALVSWLTAHTTSTIVVLGLLPNATMQSKVMETNRKYRALAKPPRVVYVECGQDLDAADTSKFRDGLHPTTEAYHSIVRCLASSVIPLLPGGRPAPQKSS